MNYTIGQYRDSETGRSRWAVFCGQTRTWYFPSRYGQKAAQALARELNTNIEK